MNGNARLISRVRRGIIPATREPNYPPIITPGTAFLFFEKEQRVVYLFSGGDNQ